MRADVTRSPYGPLHAILAGAALVLIACGFPLSSKDIHNLWVRFLYGVKMPTDVRFMTITLALTIVLFGSVWLLAWASTQPWKRKAEAGPALTASDRAEGVRFALRWSAPITAVTLGACMAITAAFEALTGVELAEQSLVDMLRGDGGFAAKAVVALIVVVEAPLLEEPLFRGIVFRGFARSMPLWGAMALSGFAFALVHVNAAAFVPLWFLGAAFAWIYWRTGTILAPMTAHLVFNFVNLCIALVFPGA